LLSIVTVSVVASPAATTVRAPAPAVVPVRLIVPPPVAKLTVPALNPAANYSRKLPNWFNYCSIICWI
jgi:hypothetical protein